MRGAWLPAVVGLLAAGAEAAPPEVAPDDYGKLLDTYLSELPAGDAGIETRFDYAAFLASEGQKELRADLRARFLDGDPAELDAGARLAWAVNAYNFLVIDVVIEAMEADPELDSIADIGGDGSYAVFDEARFTIAGETVSLNRLEREFAFLNVDRDSGRLPEGLDPRLHFALVCAAKGCPALWPEPFTAGRLDELLTRVTQNALASHRHLRIEGNRVHVGQIFTWYAADFRGEIPAFLGRHHGGAAKVLKDGADVTPDIPWDWSLNAP